MALVLAGLGIATPWSNFIPYAAAVTEELSYWLKLGRGRQKIECPGATAASPFKVSNDAGSWTRITGVVTCQDSGNSYVYDIQFLDVEINPAQRANIGRDSLIFDWAGLVVYGPDGKAGVNWLYDEALPIRGSLSKQGNEKIYFGKLRFSVPKERLARADHFAFYLTAQGVLMSIEASEFPMAAQRPTEAPLPRVARTSITDQHSAAEAGEQSYWLTRGGGRQKIECDGDTSERPFRVSNDAASWAQVTGVVTCKDDSNSYAYEVNFLGVEINPEQRANIGREKLIFDWLGLAVYGPDGSGGVDWLYDNAVPVRGSLGRDGNDKIYFGHLKFSVPKEKLVRADHFVFYLTAQGVFISIYAL